MEYTKPVIRILHVTSELDGGGIDRLLYDYAIRMPKNIQFDFAICDNDKMGILEQPLMDRGSRIFRFSRLRDGVQRSICCLQNIIKQGKYDVVHVHSDYKSFPALYAAWRSGVKVRIAHSHTAYEPETKIHFLVRKISASLTKLLATNLFACGRDAGKWVWGKKIGFYTMRNGINIEQFRFSPTKREELRKQFGLDNKFVVGNVARFAYQKNHEFLIDVFAELVKERNDAVLVLIGRGELEDDIKQKVNRLELTEKVLFLGVRNDVPDLLNMMDIFLLPSRYEGLGIVYIEAQANGLPCYGSAGVVPGDARVSHLMHFISLDSSVQEWTKKVVSADNLRSENGCELVREAHYDIETEATKLANKYEQMIGSNSL